LTTVHRVPTHLVSGFLGAGKTTLIRAFLRQRPAGERWAVLVNEFGVVGIDGAILQDNGDSIAVREVAGGCICCTASVTLRVALTRLLRDVRPDRLLIEPTGLGHAARVLDVLADRWLEQALEVRSVICVVDPLQFADSRTRGLESYGDMLTLADVVAVSKRTIASAAQTADVVRFVADLFPPKDAIVLGDDEASDCVRLAAPSSRRERRDRPGDEHDHDHPHDHEHDHEHELSEQQRGFVYPAEAVFDEGRLLAVFERLVVALPGLIRAKGVFRVGRERVLLQWASGRTSIEPIAHRGDSRATIIVGAGDAPAWDAVEAALRDTQWPATGRA
jgi:G3E family GTPase